MVTYQKYFFIIWPMKWWLTYLPVDYRLKFKYVFHLDNFIALQFLFMCETSHQRVKLPCNGCVTNMDSTRCQVIGQISYVLPIHPTTITESSFFSIGFGTDARATKSATLQMADQKTFATKNQVFCYFLVFNFTSKHSKWWRGL